MKYQNITIGLMLVAGLILFFTNQSKNIAISTYVSLIAIASLAFIAPLFSIVIAIPVFLIVYIDHQRDIGSLWTKIKGISIQKS